MNVIYASYMEMANKNQDDQTARILSCLLRLTQLYRCIDLSLVWIILEIHIGYTQTNVFLKKYNENYNAACWNLHSL